MTEHEKCINNYILDRLKVIKEDLYEMYEFMESEAIYKQVSRIEELIKLLTPKPNTDRKHCYCKDCAYFEYAEPINKTWYECTRSKYVKGCHKGELRHIYKSMYKCIDFLPAGEYIDYHDGINEILNNIQIRESEDEE